MTKETLKQYLHLKAEHAQISALLEELEAAMTAPKAQKLTGMPRGGNGQENPMEAMVARHIALQERYREKLSELDAAQSAIEDAIEQLDSVERTLMRLRYIKGLKWEEICVAMSYSWRQVQRTHANALEKLRNEKEPGELIEYAED